VGVSLLFVPIGVAGRLYLVTALVAGAAFLGYGLLGLRENAGTRWARNLFFLSLLYLTALFAVLMVDRIG
jgi:protoheme IX farnesyltransferase